GGLNACRPGHLAGRWTALPRTSGLSVAGQLTQLAQFGGGFRDFVQAGMNEIKELQRRRGGFERVVTTLGIFWRAAVGSDGACTCAIRFARRTARFIAIGPWLRSVRVGGG